MDLFKFNTPPGEDTHLVGGGEYINGLKTKEWIDRYRDAGSITLTSRAERGIRDFLPEGTLVGMRGNPGIMIIEDHQLSEGDSSIITTTGRSFESFFEQRVVDGNPSSYPTTGEVQEVRFDADPPWVTWVQVMSLLQRNLTLPEAGADQLDYLEIINGVLMNPEDATRESRSVARTDLYSVSKSILDVDNIGWRVIRPGPWSPASDPDNNIAVLLFDGLDRRATITMSHESGDIESAEYLWSNQIYKNVALVSGKWIEVLVGDTGLTGLQRRVLPVDAKDIDEAQTTEPTGLARTWIIAAMTSRGKEALAKHKKLALASVSPSRNAETHIYGVDYDIGDIVTVRGNFAESAPMRVTEYVYIEDQNGEIGYPTLERLDEE